MTGFAPMIDSTGDTKNAPVLRERMQAEGYLFFGQLIDPQRALQVKQDIVAILRAHYIIEDDGADPMWSGGPQPTEAEYMAVYDKIVRLESFQRLARSPETITVLEAVCEEPVQVWEQQLVRLVYPNPETASAQGIGAHQDGDPKLGYKAVRFYTCWISLMHIGATIGGLAVAPRSHTLGLLKSAGSVSSSAKGVESDDYSLDGSQLEWAVSDYGPGSAVVFASQTAHRGLPNHYDRIRLSCDFRYQPASDTASWLAHTLGPDVRRVCQQIDEILAGRALYVTTHPTPEVLDELRRRMLEEKTTTLGRAQELVREIRDNQSEVVYERR